MADPISRDRREKLLDPGATLNGIDFVEIATDDERTLRVHFLNSVPVQGTIASDFPTITGGETIATVAVKPINDATDWSNDAEGRILLTLKVAAPGDFSFYKLTVKSTALDEFFDQATFSFKARCPSDFDCETPPPPCPPLPGDAPPIDYLAKDFLSFRKALSDFSALRYPEWQERSEADFGMMFMEALCSLADDLSYTQDRIAAEASLPTATQRRSIVRHARLVDYEPQPATAARVLLQFDVQPALTSIAAGKKVYALGADSVPVAFETGSGLRDQTSYQVSEKWNRGNKIDPNSGIKPYFRDDSERCLPAGSTEMWVERDDMNFFEGQLLLIETQALNGVDPPIREIVRLTKAESDVDHLFGDPPPTLLTHIRWAAEDALKYDHDLSLDGAGQCRTKLAGNLIPATQGTRFTESFGIDQTPPALPPTPLAVCRLGPNSAPPETIVPLYQYCLQQGPLAWLSPDDPESPPAPEIRLVQQGAAPEEWDWFRSLLEAEEFDRAFTVEAARFGSIAHKNDGSTLADDYDGDEGDTIRFGDDVFGAIPDGDTVFQVTYRVGAGVSGNVAADSIRNFDLPALPGVVAVNNPFAAAGGADAETNERVRRLAPQAFRAKQFRAVLPADYERAAEQLPWVSNAGTIFRWTGSWLTVFTTVDPKASETISVVHQTELINLLNRYRLAGYESYTPSPQFASLDLIIKVCARPDAFRGDVEAAVLAALSTQTSSDARAGFFSPDNFTFGGALERSALEAVIQNAYGVAGVLCITYRQRGVNHTYVTMPETVAVADNQILRVDNDPSRPEAGSIKVIVEGGK
jgi:hypothetical protein